MAVQNSMSTSSRLLVFVLLTVFIAGCGGGSEYFPAIEPLVYNCPIEAAATKPSNDMAENNFFSHIGSQALLLSG